MVVVFHIKSIFQNNSSVICRNRIPIKPYVGYLGGQVESIRVDPIRVESNLSMEGRGVPYRPSVCTRKSNSLSESPSSKNLFPKVLCLSR